MNPNEPSFDSLPEFLLIIGIFFGVVTVFTIVTLLIRRRKLLNQLGEQLATRPALTDIQMQTLEKYFPYYQKLSEKNKLRFAHRVAEVMAEKDVILKDIEDPNELAELVTISSLIQLSFGLPAYTLPHFKFILVTPDSFTTSENDKPHRGLVDPKGIIRLSWRHLLDGIRDPSDAFAVGLHEMAHALFIENFTPNEEYHFFSHDALHQWTEVAKDTMLEIHIGSQSLFREYAGRDIHEMFAVGVEYFFEKPVEFSHQHPQLFDAFSELLNQDPKNAEDPVIKLMDALDLERYESPIEMRSTYSAKGYWTR